jgi:hypothetical protein
MPRVKADGVEIEVPQGAAVLPDVRGRGMGRLAFALLALGGFGFAQAEARPGPQDESIRAMYAYGRCVVDATPSSSRRVLSHPPGSREELALLRTVSNPLCLNGHGDIEQLDFAPQALRGAIAEAILRRDAGPRRPGERASHEPPFTALTPADIAALDEKDRVLLWGLDFAQCIDQAAPNAVADLLKTDPTSQQEDQAFQQLRAYMGPCLPQGAQMTIVKPQLRGFLAEAVYRAAYAPAGGSK